MQETHNKCFGSKNVARPFFMRKQLSTSAEMQQQRTWFRIREAEKRIAAVVSKMKGITIAKKYNRQDIEIL